MNESKQSLMIEVLEKLVEYEDSLKVDAQVTASVLRATVKMVNMLTDEQADELYQLIPFNCNPVAFANFFPANFNIPNLAVNVINSSWQNNA